MVQVCFSRNTKYNVDAHILTKCLLKDRNISGRISGLVSSVLWYNHPSINPTTYSFSTCKFVNIEEKRREKRIWME